ncbi:DUF305 domain-containing protein [Aeromicrobium sp.]|uniref:DUF305 domain-containing protein n=1 Tax=Aeromicrobium sp. TaxID=1871063 RepID=UPI003D6A4FAC
MKRSPVLVVTLVAAVVAAIAVGVFAVADRDSEWEMGPDMMTPRSTSTPGWWDDSWDSMHGASPSSEPEYLVEMVAHHEEAVAAARELTRSDRAQMRAFGASIVRTQSAQIEQMTIWLANWYPDHSTAAHYRPMMRDLTGLSGDRLDRAFLQDMVGHHMVAVMMSQHRLWQGTEHREVAALARLIRDDQHAEIIQMQRWLDRWFG